MNSSNSLKALFKSERDTFCDTLGSFTLIDIGVIESISLSGRAKVLTNRYIANERVVYQDAEVIYPGNTRGAYVADCSGSACLILFPYSCMPDTQNGKIRPSAPPYNKDGVKVLPIGNGSTGPVRHFINTAGEFSLNTDVYEIFFDEDDISLTQGDILAITKDSEGSIYVRHKNKNTGTLLFSLDENGIARSYGSKDGSVKWTDSINTNGERTFVQEDGRGNVLCQITIAVDGTLSIQSAASINMNGDTRHLVTFEQLQETMQKLYTALTTTPIAGNGSTQPTWAGITDLNISNAKAATLLTGDD